MKLVITFMFLILSFPGFSGCIDQPYINTIANQELYPGETSSLISYTAVMGSSLTSLSVLSCSSSSSDMSVNCSSIIGTSGGITLTAGSGFNEVAIITLKIKDAKGKNSDPLIFSVAPRYYKSCKEIYDTGVTVDGDYLIDSDGSGGVKAFEAKCDMTNDSGGWTLIFNHDIASAGVFSNTLEAMEVNINNADAGKYSILSKLSDFERSGQFEFRMTWPSIVGRNHWSQTSNPTDSFESVSGYSAINVDYTGNSWGGLSISNNKVYTLMDGHPSHNNWWYALGLIQLYAGGMPGPGSVTQGVTLWVK